MLTKPNHTTLADKLASIYGANAGAQRARYQHAIDTFEKHFGSAGKLYIFRAPGRVNLIGEHTDYNHGYVLPIAIDRDILLLARPRHDAEIHLVNIEPHFLPTTFSIEANVPLAEQGHWSNYARGAAHAMQHATERGFDGLVVGAAPHGVPVGAGLSSSSALTVVMVAALAHFAHTTLSKTEQVQLASDAEWHVGTRGGIMDQFVALLAQRDHALFLDCRPATDGRYRTQAVPLPPDYRVMIVNSGVHHSNVRGEFNQRVASCRAGVGLLQQALLTENSVRKVTHLRDIEADEWVALSALLPERITRNDLRDRRIDLHALGLYDMPGIEDETPLKPLARCRHVVSENQRVLAAVTALQSNDVARFGQLMDEAHSSARDNYEISCHEIDLLVYATREVDGVAGARLTGAGWGGCIVAVVHQEATEHFSTHVTARYAQETGKEATIFACRSTPGAGMVYQI